MGKTYTNIPKSRLDKMDHPWQEEKFGQNTPKGKHPDKVRVGNSKNGGLNCPCCTKMPPDELKVITRRMERRKGNQDTSNWRNNSDNQE